MVFTRAVVHFGIESRLALTGTLDTLVRKGILPRPMTNAVGASSVSSGESPVETPPAGEMETPIVGTSGELWH